MLDFFGSAVTVPVWVITLLALAIVVLIAAIWSIRRHRSPVLANALYTFNELL